MLNRTKFLEDTESAALKLSLRYDNRNDVMVRALMELGCRPQEVINIGKDELFANTNSVLVKGLKGSNDREIPVSPQLMAALLRFVPFGIKYRRFEQIWHNYIPKSCTKTLKAIRHTFAVSLYRKTKDIKLVQLALGHKSPTSTAVYTDFLYTTEELRKALA